MPDLHCGKSIGERYGLLTIIVLGETILAATMGVRGALEIGHDQTQVLVIAVAVYVLSVWALQVLPREHVPLRWAYPVGAVLAAFAAFAPQPVVVVAALLAALVVWTVAVNHREALRASSE